MPARPQRPPHRPRESSLPTAAFRRHTDPALAARQRKLTLADGIALLHAQGLAAWLRREGDPLPTLLEQFGGETLLHAITAERIESYSAHRELVTTREAVRGELRALGRVFEVCQLPNPIRELSQVAGRRRLRLPGSTDPGSDSRSRDLRVENFVPLMILSLGITRSELCGIEARDIDLARSEVSIETARGVRRIPIGEHLRPVLRAFIRSHRLLPRQKLTNLSPDEVYEILRQKSAHSAATHGTRPLW